MTFTKQDFESNSEISSTSLSKAELTVCYDLVEVGGGVSADFKEQKFEFDASDIELSFGFTSIKIDRPWLYW